MKKTAVIAVLLFAMLLCSCKSGDGDVTTAGDTVADTTVLTDGKPGVVDFSEVEVSGYVFATVGEICEGHESASGAEAYQVQKPDMATLGEDGELTVKSPGVTLIGYYKDGEEGAYVLCAFREGEGPDRTAGDPQIFEAGESFMHTSPVGGMEYFSSDDSIVDVSEAPKLSFIGSGYAVVTAASASRPFVYSFIVYDRTGSDGCIVS